MADRKTIQVTLHEATSYGGYAEARLPEAMYLSEFQDWLADLTKDVPDEFKDEVQIEIEYESDYDGPGYARLTLWYLRDETDAEMAERVARDEASAAAARRHNEQREREIYEQLRRKFG